MAEENQAQQELKEPQRVTSKDPKKVEAGKRLATISHKKREEAQNGGMNQYYGIRAIIAVAVIDGLGYYIYRTKKGQVSREVPNNPPQQPCPQTNKFEMD